MLQFQTWCDVECDKCKMCDVEHGVVWTVVSWYAECYIMQDIESCEMWWCGIVVMKNVAYAMCCVIVATSDVENDAMC